MLTVFCYDIANDKIRRRVAGILEDVAARVQYSVFECRLGRKKTEIISQRVAAELQEGDSLRVYVIGANGERRTRVFGDGAAIDKDTSYWLL